jgi:hypothetical protein
MAGRGGLPALVIFQLSMSGSSASSIIRVLAVVRLVLIDGGFKPGSMLKATLQVS